MDTLNNVTLPVQTSIKRRRRHTPAFRAKVVNLCKQPEVSVAGIAREHNLNANLVHKWIRDADKKTDEAASLPSDFLSIPLATSPAADQAVRIEIGQVTIHWPIAHIHQALPWLKALQS